MDPSDAIQLIVILILIILSAFFSSAETALTTVSRIRIRSLVEENEESGLKTGVMCLEKNKDNYKGEVLSLGNTLEEVGSNLFDALRQMDKMNIDIVYSEEFPTDGVGQAIMNRLLKSAGYKTIKA